MEKCLHRSVYYLVMVVAVALIGASSALGAATIVIQNSDAAGVGFNDATAVAPIGGNPGTTLGQQRLNAFQSGGEHMGRNPDEHHYDHDPRAMDRADVRRELRSAGIRRHQLTSSAISPAHRFPEPGIAALLLTS